jgi:hypothetical protein
MNERSGRFRHESLPHAIETEPVPKVRTQVKVRYRLKADDAEKARTGAFSNAEAQGSRVIPVARARLAVSPTRVNVGVERHPREPFL